MLSFSNRQKLNIEEKKEPILNYRLFGQKILRILTY